MGTDSEPADILLKEQARELQALFSQLIRQPMKTEELPSDVELSPREINLLVLLGDRGEMTMTDLASALSAPLSTVTRMADRLEQKGMIERFRSDRDRRIVIVKKGQKGTALQESVRQHQLSIAARMLEPLTIGERQILLELLAKLVRSLNPARL